MRDSVNSSQIGGELIPVPDKVEEGREEEGERGRTVIGEFW